MKIKSFFLINLIFLQNFAICWGTNSALDEIKKPTKKESTKPAYIPIHTIHEELKDPNKTTFIPIQQPTQSSVLDSLPSEMAEEILKRLEKNPRNQIKRIKDQKFID